MFMSILAIASDNRLGSPHVYLRNESISRVCVYLSIRCLLQFLLLKHLTITTFVEGNLQLNPAMLFSIGLVSTFITGGLTGLFLEQYVRY
jgi:cytochrome c oxidase subunit 1